MFIHSQKVAPNENISLSMDILPVSYPFFSKGNFELYPSPTKHSGAAYPIVPWENGVFMLSLLL